MKYVALYATMLLFSFCALALKPLSLKVIYLALVWFDYCAVMFLLIKEKD